jgi:FixJ family two-component response regulator
LKKFLRLANADISGCILIDMPSNASDEQLLLEDIRPIAHKLKAIVISGNASVRFAVDAVKAGAFDVLQAPVEPGKLLASIREARGAVTRSERKSAPDIDNAPTSARLSQLTLRQQEILRRILQGQSSRLIAAELGISERNAGYHRAQIMRKMGAQSIASLIQIALADRAAP